MSCITRGIYMNAKLLVFLPTEIKATNMIEHYNIHAQNQ